MWNRFIQRRILSSGGFCKNGDELEGSVNVWEFLDDLYDC
jgi:hypothetical protein